MNNLLTNIIEIIIYGMKCLATHKKLKIKMKFIHTV
jgi:hypothetical protein